MNLPSILRIIRYGALCVLLVLAGLLVFAAIHSHSTIRDVPVYVVVPTNFPSGTNTVKIMHVGIEYSKVIDKPISESEISYMKALVPRIKTTILGFRAANLTISSPTEAIMTFWRGRRMRTARFEKSDGQWHVKIDEGSVADFSKPPSFWDKLNDLLPPY